MAKLEVRSAAERTAALAALPGPFGFADMKSFIRALGETQGSSRPRIPAKTRAEVKKLLIAGRPAPRSPPPPGISLPGIQVVKKFLGLVKARR